MTIGAEPRRFVQNEAMADNSDTEGAAKKVGGPASYFPSIEKKYGQPISHWKTLIRTSDLTKHMEIVNWLKNEHGLGHGHANALVAHTLAEDAAENKK